MSCRNRWKFGRTRTAVFSGLAIAAAARTADNGSSAVAGLPEHCSPASTSQIANTQDCWLACLASEAIASSGSWVACFDQTEVR